MSAPLISSNYSSNYRLPAEWEPQRALLLAWPFEGGDWQPVLDAIQAEYTALINTVLKHQQVLLLIQPGSQDAKHQLGQLEGLVYIEVPFNDTWCRDYGPITLLDEDSQKALDFHFNGWGGRYDARLDNRVNTHLARHEYFQATDFRQSLLELEGGAIDSNGAGIILINRYCMRKRLAHLSDEAVDLELREWLGAHELLSIDMPPLDGDETDSHIDTLARFTQPDQIVFQTLRERQDTQIFLGQLEALRDHEGRAFELHALPCPDDLEAGLPASYANFVLINNAVLVPQYGSHADPQALQIFQDLYPKRTIEAVDARVLIGQGGGPHCACMQLPE